MRDIAVLDRPAISAREDETSPAPHGHWELFLTHPLEGRTVYARANLTSIVPGHMFSEQTLLVFEEGHVSTSGSTTDVEGELSAEAGSFDVHIVVPHTRLSPISCMVTATRSGRDYEGKWQMPCNQPDTCGCVGIAGSVRLSAITSDHADG